MSILFELSGQLGLITIDRPEALNAMDADMAIAMNRQLIAWADDPAVGTVAIQGRGKAFCAGGDIRSVWKMKAEAARFFDPEYDLCRTIRAYPKPYVAIMDGITMGGGVGISIYAHRRVATPNTLWAMPECAIGFYPDIGATWFLPRLPGQIGTYLALTGARLTAADLMDLHIATEFTAQPETIVKELEEGLVPSPHGKGCRIEQPRGLPVDNQSPHPALSPREREIIDRCFAFDSVEEIVAALAREPGEWAVKTLETLGRMSPTSLKVTLRQMRLGRDLSFDEAMTLERGLTRHFLQGPDFYEGIRAALIDRDGAPRWSPAKLSAVNPEMVDAFFT